MGGVQKAALTVALAAAVVVTTPCWYGWGQDADKGRAQFLEKCATCHGADAKGSGPLAAKLKIKPADLTTLVKRNNGVFDPAAVYQMIDGRDVRLNHHSNDMPIWGCRHGSESTPPTLAEGPIRKRGNRFAARNNKHEPSSGVLLDLPCGSEVDIRDRISSIVEYLSLIQEK